MIKQTHLVNRALKKTWVAVAILIILAAIFSSVFRSLTPWAKQYKGEVEHHLSMLIGQPVTIKTMETGWYWFHPVLKLDQVAVHDQQNSLHLDKLLVGINVLKSLWYWQIQPGVLYVENIHVTIREHDGKWTLDGLSTGGHEQSEFTAEKLQALLGWLSRQEKLILKRVSAHVYLSHGHLIPLSGLNISIINRSGHYQLKGDVTLQQTNASYFQLLGDMYFDPLRLQDTKGQLYFSAKRVLPAQWQLLFPKISERLQGGKGDIDLWLDLNHGMISSIQAKLKVKRLAWRLLNTKNSQMIQSLTANMAWKPSDQGWVLSADQVKLRMGGVKWPENKVLIQFDKKQQSYQFYAKALVVESLLSEAMDWPEAMKKWLQYKPHGFLKETQMLYQAHQLTYFLTRFENLGWHAVHAVPSVDHLSGVLSWQPAEGKLELDSEKTVLGVKGYPTQTFDVLNAAIDWKALSHGLRVSIERFVLSQPELTVTAEGVMDGVNTRSLGQLRLFIDFSGKNLHQWLPYLPAQWLKPKLLHWLQKDIQQIAQGTGRVVVNGLAKDFPFDNHSGEFSIVGHGSGINLLITPEWLPIHQIEAYIRLKNRNLEFDLVNGEAIGVRLKQMHLRVDDIGKDRENLMIHGLINAPIQKMLQFVLSSPLKAKLSKLSKLVMQGEGLLNLRLQIPLYPQNDQVLAKGILSFKQNSLKLKHGAGEFAIHHLNGELSFNESGVSESSLLGLAFGYPIRIKIQSEKKPEPLTSVQIDGECAVEFLKKQFNWPLFSYLKGAFHVKAHFKLTDNPNDFDKVLVQTTFKGLSIDLPKPLGKLANTTLPSEAILDFNPKKGYRLRANYNGRLSADLLFKEHHGALQLYSGQLTLGSAYAVEQNKQGLEVKGSLAGFDLTQWKSVWDQFPQQSLSSGWLDTLRAIDVRLGQFTFLKQNFDGLLVKAHRSSGKEWVLSVQQKNILADLTYNPSNYSFNGYFKKLYLAPYRMLESDTQSLSNSRPDQIPGLNLRIEQFKLGDLQVGDVTLKSHSSPEQWSIDYCRIDSPVYHLMAQGEWIQKEKSNRTQMQIRLQMTDLAKTLERWQITPAVDAGKGEVDFDGGWRGRLYDFSLSRVKGKINLKLKKGIITHLSHETEEKLGLGKLLSVLSLQTIPRRLTLDFSDLASEGYSFDVFKGHFAINNGIMTTEDSYLDGPVAHASMKGDLDLVKRLYHLNLTISPHITASLPVVATIAGGPVAGLAAWVASKIINRGIEKISSYSYKISGPWSQPVVQQISIVKKKR